MPLYEYRCDACEHQFEVIQSFSDKPLKKCEKCGGRVQKLISRAGFILKGGGWFKQDYSSAKPSSGSKDSSSSESSSASDASAATSDAPAATTSGDAAKPPAPGPAKKPKAAKG